MSKKPQGYTAVNIKFEAKRDLDVLCVLLAARLGRRLTLSDAITEARRALDPNFGVSEVPPKR